MYTSCTVLKMYGVATVSRNDSRGDRQRAYVRVQSALRSCVRGPLFSPTLQPDLLHSADVCGWRALVVGLRVLLLHFGESNRRSGVGNLFQNRRQGYIGGKGRERQAGRKEGDTHVINVPRWMSWRGKRKGHLPLTLRCHRKAQSLLSRTKLCASEWVELYSKLCRSSEGTPSAHVESYLLTVCKQTMLPESLVLRPPSLSTLVPSSTLSRALISSFALELKTTGMLDFPLPTHSSLTVHLLDMSPSHTL